MSRTIDFYIPVIDNYWDMGFALNLAASLNALYPDFQFRFFSEDHTLFARLGGEKLGEYFSFDVLEQKDAPVPSNLIFNFFDRKLPREYFDRFSHSKTIISFGYFLLHDGASSLHNTNYLLENWQDRVIHFIPSLLHGTGGVIVNPEIERRNKDLANCLRAESRRDFLKGCHPELVSGSSACDKMEDSEMNSEWRVFDFYRKKWISVFVYPDTLEQIQNERISMQNSQDTIFFLFAPNEIPRVDENLVYMPFLSPEEYALFQSLCDANIVRGENSLCQSLIAGKPTLWDIYKESNNAHIEKIEDFLEFLRDFLPISVFDRYARIYREFNGNRKDEAFLEFVNMTEDLENAFEKVSEYIKEECDLVKKLEDLWIFG